MISGGLSMRCVGVALAGNWTGTGAGGGGDAALVLRNQQDESNTEPSTIAHRLRRHAFGIIQVLALWEGMLPPET